MYNTTFSDQILASYTPEVAAKVLSIAPQRQASSAVLPVRDTLCSSTRYTKLYGCEQTITRAKCPLLTDVRSPCWCRLNSVCPAMDTIFERKIVVILAKHCSTQFLDCPDSSLGSTRWCDMYWCLQLFCTLMENVNHQINTKVEKGATYISEQLDSIMDIVDTATEVQLSCRYRLFWG